MKIEKKAQAGTLQSNDCLIRIFPSEEGLCIWIDSPVLAAFGEQMEQVARETLDEAGVAAARLEIEDRGALDCTLRARLQTAIRRAAQ